MTKIKFLGNAASHFIATSSASRSAATVSITASNKRLDGVAGSRVRIVSLRGADGPGLELLNYETPGTARKLESEIRPNDLSAWRIVIESTRHPEAELRDPDQHRLLVRRIPFFAAQIAHAGALRIAAFRHELEPGALCRFGHSGAGLESDVDLFHRAASGDAADRLNHPRHFEARENGKRNVFGERMKPSSIPV